MNTRYYFGLVAVMTSSGRIVEKASSSAPTRSSSSPACPPSISPADGGGATEAPKPAEAEAVAPLTSGASDQIFDALIAKDLHGAWNMGDGK